MKQVWKLTMTTIGLVRIFFALAAYRSVFTVSLTFDRAGDMQAICQKGNILKLISSVHDK